MIINLCFFEVKDGTIIELIKAVVLKKGFLILASAHKLIEFFSSWKNAYLLIIPG